MSPLTRPGSNQSLVNQPTVMDEYADAIEAITGLPSSLLRPQDFSTVTAQVVSAAENTTDWFEEQPSVSPTLAQDTAVKKEGSASIRGDAHGSFHDPFKMYYRRPTALARGNNTHLSMWIRHGLTPGWGFYEPADHLKIRVSDGIALEDNYVEVSFPYIAYDHWTQIIIDVTNLTGVRSVGYRSYQVGTGFFTRVWIDDIRLMSLTEAENALQSASVTGVLIPPTYVPGLPENRTLPNSNKVTVDLRPGRQYVSGLGGVIDIREFGNIPDDGSADVTGELQAVINSLPENSTLRLTANKRYRVDGKIRISNRNLTIDGQGSMLFYDGLKNNLSYIEFWRAQNVTIRNLKIIGYATETILGKDLRHSGGTISGNDMILDAANDYAESPGNFINSFDYVTRDKDGYWRFKLDLTTSATMNADIEITGFQEVVTDVGSYGPNVYFNTGDINTPADYNNFLTIYKKTHALSSGRQTIEIPIYPEHRAGRLKIRMRITKTGAAGTITVHSFLDHPLRARFAGPPTEFNYGIQLQSGQDLLLENLYISGMGGDAIGGHGNQIRGEEYSNVTIRDCQFWYNRRHGLSLENGQDVTLDNVAIMCSGYQGIDIEPAGMAYKPQRLVFNNVRVDGETNGGIVIQGSDTVTDKTLDVTLTDCYVKRARLGFFVEATRILMTGCKHEGLFVDSAVKSVIGSHGGIVAGCLLSGKLELPSHTTDTLFSSINFVYPANSFPITGPTGQRNRFFNITTDDGVDEFLFSDLQRAVRTGTGTPEGVVTASIGSMFLRKDGGAGTTLYIKETGAGNTGWAAK